MIMKKYLIIALTACLCMTVQSYAQNDWANIGRYAEANASLTTTPKAVFMGDSITQCWWDADPSHAAEYPVRLPRTCLCA